MSFQPHADPSLLNTTPTTHSIADDAAKVNLVDPNFKSHPHTYTSEQQFTAGGSDDDFPHSTNKKKMNKHIKEAEAEGAYLWDVAKQYLFRPGVAGGVIGLVNVGLLAGASRAFYVNPHYRRDTTVISSTVAATVALLSAEGYAAEQYRKTPRGQDEERRAKQEGTLIYKHLREQILRPNVLGGLVGVVNAGILGTIGYYSYVNWDKPSWDRRTVSAITLALLTLWTGEGFLAEQYHEKKRSRSG